MLLCRLQCVTRAKPTDNVSPAGGKHPRRGDIDCSIMLTSEHCNRLLSIQCCFISVITLVYTGVKPLLRASCCIILRDTKKWEQMTQQATSAASNGKEFFV
jgi:hypothetical protein